MLRAGAFRRHIEILIRADNGGFPSLSGMNHTAPRLVLGGLAVVVVAVVGTHGYSSASSAAGSFADVLPGDHQGALTAADGVVPDGATVFDDQLPAVAKLDPDLLSAVRRAAPDAAHDGVEIQLNSGWRSSAYQEQLLRAAIAKYGSEKALPGGWPPRRRPHTSPATPSTSAPPMRRPGCPSTAPTTACARSTTTSPGTTSCVPMRSTTAAR